ncbi:ABC transporter ATP-binding protein/permease [Mangrovicoccus sp. HB161399]|uniref:ABC transporter ATP-binding protein/permease n=1 Tax=Mangrovicoccus sp. HB161399 TaxID=2720392 RepID=UPI0015578582|nr:ABC transporter ATP-binding protein/permease [Mangrovicoccus sp. HB161399]
MNSDTQSPSGTVRQPAPGRQLAGLVRALAKSRQWRPVGALAAGVALVICANAAGQIRLNVWQRDFYQAIEQREFHAFLVQLAAFGAIAGGLLVLVVGQTWLQEMLKVRLRAWLTRDLIGQWLEGRRPCLLGFLGEIAENPDQRVQQDAQHLADLTTSLLAGLLQSTLLLASFVGVLWVLSAQVAFDFGHGPVSVPGYMVWCALAFSAGGSALGWRVGRPLVQLNAERYAREAELRSALVRVAENADGIVLEDGAADERRLLAAPVDAVIGLMARLAGGLARLTWVTSGYGWLGLVVPVVVAAPGYFGGQMSFGTLMMVVGAFQQVQSALRWFVDNLAVIADWRATLNRVAAFRDALQEAEAIGEGTGRIAVSQDPADGLEFAGLSLALAGTCASLDAGAVRIAPGERVQILCATEEGRNVLFRALAGIWPWGSGSLALPPREQMTFLPERPYLPPGTLRSALCYPAPPEAFGEDAAAAALERAGLSRLVPQLGRSGRWDRDLSLGEQQRLGLARVLLHRPRWIVLNEATSALGRTQDGLPDSLWNGELDGAAVVRLGQEPLADGSWSRTLALSESAGGPCLPALRMR